MKNYPDVFTTGEAAKICRLSQLTIIRCFDKGMLRGFKVPGSRFRRIPKENLEKFMMDNGLPMDLLPKMNKSWKNGKVTQ